MVGVTVIKQLYKNMDVSHRHWFTLNLLSDILTRTNRKTELERGGKWKEGRMEGRENGTYPLA